MANKYHHEDLRSILVATASLILEEEGIENLTMRHLSRKTGVSRSAPYRHFEDKTALLGAVAAHGFGRLGTCLSEVSNEDPSFLDTFSRCCSAYVRFAVSRPTLYTMMFGFELTDGAPVPELAEASDRAFSLITGFIDGCQGNGDFRGSDPVELANVAWSSLHGLSMLLIDGAVRMKKEDRLLHTLTKESGSGRADDIPAISGSVIETLVRGFRPDRG